MPAFTPSSSSDGELPIDIEKQNTRDIATQERRQTQEESILEVNEEDEQWKTEQEPDFLGVNPTGALGRVLSRISTSASKNPGPPPDGGKKAWLMCFCGHLIITNTWGFINSFGVFQTYYMELLDLPPSDISWIGSITVFLTFFIGTFTGRLVDAGFLVTFPVIYIPVVNHTVFKHTAIGWEWGVVVAAVIVYIALVEAWKAGKRRLLYKSRPSSPSV
ncbi:hypothetical protein NUW58_g3405 [Xylaria curta]|uniref:Uncharacterized protein n=1 Tax=Xylaria curta TaxID=42375 RepID=A0ACC1PCM9_9PEZI|nr:hypothetical protein NUW58_g3405 [Xylaria curta]